MERKSGDSDAVVIVVVILLVAGMAISTYLLSKKKTNIKKEAIPVVEFANESGKEIREIKVNFKYSGRILEREFNLGPGKGKAFQISTGKLSFNGLSYRLKGILHKKNINAVVKPNNKYTVVFKEDGTVETKYTRTNQSKK